MFVHLSVSPADVTGDTGTRWPALDERLSLYAGARCPWCSPWARCPPRSRPSRGRRGCVSSRARHAGACAATSSRPGPSARPRARVHPEADDGAGTRRRSRRDRHRRRAGGGGQPLAGVAVSRGHRGIRRRRGGGAPAGDALDGASALATLPSLVEKEDPTAAVAVTGIALEDRRRRRVDSPTGSSACSAPRWLAHAYTTTAARPRPCSTWPRPSRTSSPRRS